MFQTIALNKLRTTWETLLRLYVDWVTISSVISAGAHLEALVTNVILSVRGRYISEWFKLMWGTESRVKPEANGGTHPCSHRFVQKVLATALQFQQLLCGWALFFLLVWLAVGTHYHTIKWLITFTSFTWMYVCLILLHNACLKFVNFKPNWYVFYKYITF